MLPLIPSVIHLLKLFACIDVADDALWVSSYLSNRKQFVQIKNAQSESVTVTQGVPQGSVLGLFHFIIRLLSNLLQLYIPSRSLRSSSAELLRVPHFKLSSFGSRAFSCVSPELWNSLPLHICQLDLKL